MAIVTRKSLQELFSRGDTTSMHAIGRALVVVFNNQTSGEQHSNEANPRNKKGFTNADAYSGCLSAKFYIRHRKLEHWQIVNWTTNNRLAKYHKQIDVAAVEKAAKRIKNV